MIILVLFKSNRQNYILRDFEREKTKGKNSAVDNHEVRFCTDLKGKASCFLHFNMGWNDGAGNPPNPNGLKTDYLWKHILRRESLTNLLENYAQIVGIKDEKTK